MQQGSWVQNVVMIVEEIIKQIYRVEQRVIWGFYEGFLPFYIDLCFLHICDAY